MTGTDDIEPAKLPTTVLQLISLQAQRDGGAEALIAPGRTPMTYDALLHAIGGIQASLAAAGFGREHRIALALPNSAAMAVMLLAVSDCAVCAPLNPVADVTASEVLMRAMRVDALIVAEGADVPALHAARAMSLPILRLAVGATGPAGTCSLITDGAHVPSKARSQSSGDFGLLMHTSGTTATPKVVPLTRRLLADSAIARARLLRITSADRCLSAQPMFTTSFSKRNLLPVLTSGGTLICVDRFDAALYIDALQLYRPTFFSGNPTTHRAMLDALEKHAPIAHALRFVISSSAPLSAALHAGLERALGVPVLHAYAMTEGGAIAQTPLPPGEGRVGSAGISAGGEVAVLGDDGAFVVPGTEGEIVVRGPEVFDGYEGDADANRYTFHDGWFRTGDRGYVDVDGYIFITGRLKEVINRGGAKVSPSEVDASLLAHPDVAEAATFAVPHATLGEDVCAAVMLREGATVSAQQLRDMAMQRLSAYKVPSRIVVVTTIPKNALGKFRRNDFAQLFEPHLHAVHVAPSGERENAIASIFASALGVTSVGALDNFFELGGDSLRCAQVVARVNAELGCDIDVSRLFWRPTVAEFAGEVAAFMQDPGIRSRYPSPQCRDTYNGDASAGHVETRVGRVE